MKSIVLILMPIKYLIQWIRLFKGSVSVLKLKNENMRELIYYFDNNDVDFIYLTTTIK